jgi:DNA helicase-2/ATP-dependent DNA helicase PcrA
MVPQRFYTHGQRGNGDRHVYAQRTRFIPNGMLTHFTNCAWPLPGGARRSGDTAARQPVDVRAKLRRMWG